MAECSCCCEEKKESKEKITKVYFCPKCKSTDVGYVFGLKNVFGIIPQMQCKKCKFKMMSFPQWAIGDKSLKKANSKLNKKSKKK
jgi:hypothetical protein